MLNEAGKEIRVFIDTLDSQFSTELSRSKLTFYFYISRVSPFKQSFQSIFL